MSALALRKLEDPHFDEMDEIVKHLRHKVKNGFDYTMEVIGIDTAKLDKKAPTYKGPDLSSIDFGPLKLSDYFDNHWLLTTDYKFGKDPNNPYLKDFKFKDFDTSDIFKTRERQDMFHKTSASNDGVKDALAHFKTNESKHGDITGYVDPIALNLGLQNKTWGDIAESKRQFEELTEDVTRDAVDHGFINQMKIDRMERRGKKVFGADKIVGEAITKTYDDAITGFHADVKPDAEKTSKDMAKLKKAGVKIDPIYQIKMAANSAQISNYKKDVDAKRAAAIEKMSENAKKNSKFVKYRRSLTETVALKKAEEAAAKSPEAKAAAAAEKAKIELEAKTQTKAAAKAPTKAAAKTPTKAQAAAQEAAIQDIISKESGAKSSPVKTPKLPPKSPQKLVEAAAEKSPATKAPQMKAEAVEHPNVDLEEVKRLDAVYDGIIDKHVTTEHPSQASATSALTDIYKYLDTIGDILVDEKECKNINKMLTRLGIPIFRGSLKTSFKTHITKGINKVAKMTPTEFLRYQKQTRKPETIQGGALESKEDDDEVGPGDSLR